MNGINRKGDNMQITKRVLIVLALAAIALPFCSNMALSNALNVRPTPVFIGDAPSLQTIFNNITVSGPGINAATDQDPYALFTSQGSGGAVATMIIEVAGNEASNSFGIYSASNSANRATIFAGAASEGSQAIVSFMADGSIKVNFVTVATNFGSTFGFFLDGPGGTFFTEDSLNGGNPQALVFQGDNSTVIKPASSLAAGTFSSDEYIFAFEDMPYLNGSDKDFNDMVVIVESISPVPEPGTLLFLGTGLGLIGFLGYRRKSK
jgi:hypothetical protein